MSIKSVGIELSVCCDCVQYAEYHEGTTQEHATAYYKGIASWTGRAMTRVHVDGETLTAFSKSPCELCNSPLYGERFSAWLFVNA